LAILLSNAALVMVSYIATKNLVGRHLASSGDDLTWFRREFHLGDSEMTRIRQLHEGYMPKCQEMCHRIAAKKKELETALVAGKGVTPHVEQMLSEIASLRARCQTQMLRHFCEVSQAMPPEQGRRYLAEMQQLTLGFHEQFERTMSSGGHSLHGHD
jgi:hypothetical protein